MASIIDGGILIGLVPVGFAGMLVGYNATVRLTIDSERITLTRYGLRVWSAPTQGMLIESGWGGDFGVQSAYVFIRGSERVGYVLRGWFEEADIAALQAVLANVR